MNIPKMSAEDTYFVTTNAAGEKVEVPVPAGTGLGLSVGDMHYHRTMFLFQRRLNVANGHLSSTLLERCP